MHIICKWVEQYIEHSLYITLLAHTPLSINWTYKLQFLLLILKKKKTFTLVHAFEGWFMLAMKLVQILVEITVDTISI